MAIEFSRSQILDRIKLENPWWISRKIDPFYGDLKKREYFKSLFPYIQGTKVKRALVLMGPRRVGKTVIIHHAIQELLNIGINEKNICYFSIENPLYNSISLEEFIQLFIEINNPKEGVKYIFFDEIQYLKNWEIHLKSLVDSYHDYKFIVSGSAAAALKLKSNESGAGRFTDFLLPPLTFHEYLVLTENDNIIEEKPSELIQNKFEYNVLDISLLNNLFIEYINYGGYPELSLNESIRENPSRYIKSDIIDKVLLRDLPSLYGINDIQELNNLFTHLSYNSGLETSLEELSKKSGISKNTIKKYITYLEAAFLIKVINRIDKNAKTFKRAVVFKVYLTNPSLRSALFQPIKPGDDHFGAMVETAIFSQWQHNFHGSDLYYARWKTGEIDIVNLDARQKPFWCIEIKWSNSCVNNLNRLSEQIKFCQTHHLDYLKATTIDIEKEVEYKGVNIHFTPSSLYCYTVGRNLVTLRKTFDLST